MYIDGSEIDRDSVVEADVCVIGGGAVGIPLTRELAEAGLEVVLLESGSQDFDQATQDLYAGVESGTLLGPDTEYLSETRNRYYGGTTNTWNGWCRPLDPEDLQVRDWVADSGWPIEQEEMQAFHRRAARVVQIKPFDEAEGNTPTQILPIGPEAQIENSFLHCSAPTRFAARFKKAMRQSKVTRVFFNSNAVEILTNDDATRVEGIAVASLAGNRFRVRSRAYVLATGGIENARILLASNRVQKEGLGNGHDLVGRYFMDHPLLRVGFLVMPGRAASMKAYSTTGPQKNRYRGIIRVRPEVQRKHRLLNALAIVKPRKPEFLPELALEIDGMAGEILSFADRELAAGATYFGTLGIASEQVPNRDSRVRLADERDELGMPRTRLEWQLTEQDARSVRLTSEIMVRNLAASFGGRGKLLVTESEPWPRAYTSFHHMGATRMDPNPKKGVVDVDSKVHGIANLWVGGSSVYPTVGCSNPTFEIVTLALRLGDHLKGVLAT
jgi:choline dehydrogenase-like flavoprotein